METLMTKFDSLKIVSKILLEADVFYRQIYLISFYKTRLFIYNNCCPCIEMETIPYATKI